MLPRGQVLVMGGDQVYPTASGDGYEDRCKGPYRAALPEAAGRRAAADALRAARQPRLVRRPDRVPAAVRPRARTATSAAGAPSSAGRTSRCELPPTGGCSRSTSSSARTSTTRSWSTSRRPPSELGPDDRIILLRRRRPGSRRADEPEAYDAIDYFIRTILAPTGAQVRLLLSGDLHHYARYTGADRELITCGGGGAYL